MNEKISGQRGREAKERMKTNVAPKSQNGLRAITTFFGLTQAYNVHGLCGLFDVEDSTGFQEAEK